MKQVSVLEVVCVRAAMEPKRSDVNMLMLPRYSCGRLLIELDFCFLGFAELERFPFIQRSVKSITYQQKKCENSRPQSKSNGVAEYLFRTI